MVDADFFKKFFRDFLTNLGKVSGKNAGVEQLFFEMPLQKLEDFVDSSLYSEFSDFTNTRIDKNGNISTDFIDYVVNLNARRFGKVYNSIHFTKISKKIIDYINSNFSMSDKMNKLKSDIIDFAVSAPVSARSLRFQIYRGYIKKIPIAYIEKFLEGMAREGLLKKKGGEYVLP